ncbi:zinc finger nuclease 2 [Striga asiatica]|uniref:Zinc finger nuclease 2 n=1 Tax=Striga asiatica TaxID=4170 RepID=A0A5A7QZG0_STRAF|nr:zinc finger nuclease 2 [Striga asiatica]
MRDILLLGHHVPEAPTRGVLERDAGRLWTQNPVNVVAIVQLVIEPFRHLDRLRRVAVLDDDQVVLLEKRPPHLEKIEVPNRGYDDVELVLQEGGCGYGSGHGWI